MNPFTYDQLPARIVFGAGRLAEVGAEVERLGGRHVMLISDGAATAPASVVTGQLGSRLAVAWNEVAQHVPAELAERARTAATEASIVGLRRMLCRSTASATSAMAAIARGGPGLKPAATKPPTMAIAETTSAAT